ncbi:hypothetical protein ACA910_000958 [Epithemia clementina (nom. ined.)]
MAMKRQAERRVLPHYFYPFLLFLISALSRTIVAEDDDPSDPCSTHALNAYRKCIMENACSCQNCGDPNNPDWVIDVPEPESCWDLSQIFCPLVKCCKPCETVASFYHNCLAQDIAQIYVGESHDCQLFVCPMETYDTECSPETVTEAMKPCATQVSAYKTCVESSSECSLECEQTLVSQLLFDSSSKTCDEMNNDIFCPLSSCCPSCRAELDAVAVCAKENVANVNDMCPSAYCPAATEQPSSMPSESPGTSSVSALESQSGAETWWSQARRSYFYSMAFCLVLVASYATL